MSCIQLGHIFSQILHTLPILCIPKCRFLKVVTVFRPQELAKQKVPGGIRLSFDSKPIVLSRSIWEVFATDFVLFATHSTSLNLTLRNHP